MTTAIQDKKDVQNATASAQTKAATEASLVVVSPLPARPVVTQVQTTVPVHAGQPAQEAMGITADAITNGFSTLVGAIIGAGLAYWFQNRAIKRQEEKKALMSAHRTLFMQLQQSNTILLIQRDFIYSELKNPARYISIPPVPPFDVNKNIICMNDVDFLLETPEGRLILNDLYIAQDAYLEAINHLNLRSSIHAQQVQPALANAGIKSGSPMTLNMIDNALGELLAGVIKNTTDNCIISLRLAFEKLAVLKVKVRAYAVKQYPTEQFLDFDYPETWGLADNEGDAVKAEATGVATTK